MYPVLPKYPLLPVYPLALVTVGIITAKEKLAEPIWGTASVTVIVYSVAVTTAVGVPEILPVDVLKINPGGKLVGLIA